MSQMLPTIEDLVRGNSVNDYDKSQFLSPFGDRPFLKRLTQWAM